MKLKLLVYIKEDLLLKKSRDCRAMYSVIDNVNIDKILLESEESFGSEDMSWSLYKWK